jgi:hypothetical protein
MSAKYIFVTGGVVSSLGKGLVAGPPLRVLQRWGPMQPVSRFSIRSGQPHRPHPYKERKGASARWRSARATELCRHSWLNQASP